MNILNRKDWIVFLLASFVTALVVASSPTLVTAQDPSKITYPVVELGKCIDFVEKFNLVSSDDLKEIRQVADAKKAGVAFPGNCKTKESCMNYCENSANAVVCMEFALKAGFIPKEDAEAVGKILPYLKSGGKMPGGCATKESCDAYC